jgi:acyl carrier protein
MTVVLDRPKVFAKVRDILVEVLIIDPQEVSDHARVILDLGAESIDLLDLRFRVERAFGFSITNENLIAAFGTEITPTEFRERFTVDALCAYIERRLGERVA